MNGTKLEFPPEERDEVEREAIGFPARADGLRINCLISYEALQSRFGATITSMPGTFKDNQASIQVGIYELIDAGVGPVNGELILNIGKFWKPRLMCNAGVPMSPTLCQTVDSFAVIRSRIHQDRLSRATAKFADSKARGAAESLMLTSLKSRCALALPESASYWIRRIRWKNGNVLGE